MEVCKFRNTSKSRVGLYFMTFLAMIGSFSTYEVAKGIVAKINGLDTQKILNRLDNLESSMASSMPVLKEENGQKFYQFIDGQRAYIEINGRPAWEYTTNTVQLENK